MNIDEKALEKELEKKIVEDVGYWAKPRRAHWDEWGSPVGLTLAWALFVIPLGVFLHLLHLAGLL